MPSMLEVIPVLPAVRYRCPTKQWRVLICLLQLGLCYDELAMGRLNFVIVFEHRWWLMFGNYEWLSCIATWLLYILVTLNRVWSPVFARPFYVHNLVRLCAYIERGTHFWHPLTFLPMLDVLDAAVLPNITIATPAIKDRRRGEP